jgi:crotonobetainyl-CoA:carnitine CoA-transferase CaiB-like acyl-CoA transferase
VSADPVLPPPPDVMARAQAIADELPIPVDLDELVMGRARLAGLRARGRTSAGGTCRLLAARDGWVAVNLARATDVESVPAIVEEPVDPDDPWSALERFAATHTAAQVAARGQLLDVPAAVLDDPTVIAADAVRVHQLRPAADVEPGRRVIDLTAMWAGPLCARLLGLSGMEVVKVESTTRPDGARQGDPDFYAWLHHGHGSVVLDLTRTEGRADLSSLVAEADVVLESSRPRALAQLGIDAAAVVRSRPGVTWVSITGYGREGPGADRVAFGDDAAVAGGLVDHDADGLPVFCADAIADPLTGLQAAVAALHSREEGGGHLIELSMSAVAKRFAATE